VQPSTSDHRHQRVALVTGASRGIGRGVAIALGVEGWTVWVTGRSTRTSTTSHLPGTVEDTAEAVTSAGGHGIAAACDHRDDEQVRDVIQRIPALHLLVNNVWAGYERLNAGAWEEWNAPFWEQPLELWDAMFAGGVRAHYVTTALAAPLLIAAKGTIVTVSMEAGEEHKKHFGVAYSVAKAAQDRFALATSTALAEHGVASVALHPGLVRTEGVMQFEEHLDLTGSQSPEGVGRVIVALANDPNVMNSTGQALSVDRLATIYDVDVNV
jgi:NAD(P)-dependent dehydrogenase (short-subunit alcohol dehydrogenase family)